MGNGSGIFKSFAIAVVIILSVFLLFLEEAYFGRIISKNPIFKPLFRVLIKSNDYRITKYAADSLLHRVSPDDFEFWLGILKDESSDTYLQGHALLAMRVINNPEAVNVITKVYEKTPKLNGRSSNLNWEWAFSALAQMKKSEFCPEILKTLNENHSELKIAALNVIHYCPSDVIITNVKNTLTGC